MLSVAYFCNSFRSFASNLYIIIWIYDIIKNKRNNLNVYETIMWCDCSMKHDNLPTNVQNSIEPDLDRHTKTCVYFKIFVVALIVKVWCVSRISKFYCGWLKTSKKVKLEQPA